MGSERGKTKKKKRKVSPKMESKKSEMMTIDKLSDLKSAYERRKELKNQELERRAHLYELEKLRRDEARKKRAKAYELLKEERKEQYEIEKELRGHDRYYYSLMNVPWHVKSREWSQRWEARSAKWKAKWDKRSRAWKQEEKPRIYKISVVEPYPYEESIIDEKTLARRKKGIWQIVP